MADEAFRAHVDRLNWAVANPTVIEGLMSGEMVALSGERLRRALTVLRGSNENLWLSLADDLEAATRPTAPEA